MLLRVRWQRTTLFTTILLTVLSYTYVAQADPGASALGPLENEALELSSADELFTTIATDINRNIGSSADTADSSFIDLSTMPIIRDFVNEAGDVALPIHQSISVEVVDSFGDYGVGLGTRF